MKRLYRASTTVALFLIPTVAVAEPVDSFKCNFVVKDSKDRLLASDQVAFDVARNKVDQRSRAFETEFSETRSWFRFDNQSSREVYAGFEIEYELATNGTLGFQNAYSHFTLCAGHGDKFNCLEPGPIEPCDSSEPYACWRRVPVGTDSLPQLDPVGLLPGEREVTFQGKIYRFLLDCTYMGLTE